MNLIQELLTRDTTGAPTTNHIAQLLHPEAPSIEPPVDAAENAALARERKDALLTADEKFAAQEFDLSPSEYRQYQNGKEFLDTEKMKNSPHVRVRRKYEAEWKQQEEQEAIQSIENMGQEEQERLAREKVELDRQEAQRVAPIKQKIEQINKTIASFGKYPDHTQQVYIYDKKHELRELEKQLVPPKNMPEGEINDWSNENESSPAVVD